MRFHRRKRIVDGQTRTVTKFLWLPKRLNIGCSAFRETRWLEKTKIFQKVVGTHDPFWNDECFVEDKR